jgi:hypothetical protein
MISRPVSTGPSVTNEAVVTAASGAPGRARTLKGQERLPRPWRVDSDGIGNGHPISWPGFARCRGYRRHRIPRATDGHSLQSRQPRSHVDGCRAGFASVGNCGVGGAATSRVRCRLRLARRLLRTRQPPPDRSPGAARRCTARPRTHGRGSRACRRRLDPHVTGKRGQEDPRPDRFSLEIEGQRGFRHRFALASQARFCWSPCGSTVGLTCWVPPRGRGSSTRCAATRDSAVQSDQRRATSSTNGSAGQARAGLDRRTRNHVLVWASFMSANALTPMRLTQEVTRILGDRPSWDKTASTRSAGVGIANNGRAFSPRRTPLSAARSVLGLQADSLGCRRWEPEWQP